MDVTIYTYCILKDASTRGSGVKPPTLRSHDDHTATNQEVHKFRGKELISSCCTALCGVMLHFWPHPIQWCHNNWLAYYKNTWRHFSFYFSQKGAETGVTTHWHYYDTWLLQTRSPSGARTPTRPLLKTATLHSAFITRHVTQTSLFFILYEHPPSCNTLKGTACTAERTRVMAVP